MVLDPVALAYGRFCFFIGKLGPFTLETHS